MISYERFQQVRVMRSSELPFFPSAAARAAPGPVALPESAMAISMQLDAGGSANSERLAVILDKLVTVDLDLEPICRIHGDGDGLSLASAHDAIAGACDTLHSAIGDLRAIVHQVDGLKYLLPGTVHPDRKSAVAQAIPLD